MNTNLSIFGPFFALGFWTFLVLNVLGVSRIRAGAKGLLRQEDFRLGESERIPERVRLANRNYMNLLELPVLFYAVTLVAYTTATATQAMVFVAWLFVALRVIHSIIHLTTNNVMHRLYAFVASNTTLLVLWVLAAVALWSKSAA
jgi:hypothetical protein